MPLTPAERIRVLVRCDHCGKTSEKFLRGLIGVPITSCLTPGCPGPIDLHAPENAVLIEKLAEQLPSLDAAFAQERGQS